MQPANLPAKTVNALVKLGAEAVETFLIMLREGIKCWQAAGGLLVEMRKDDPGVYRKIIQREPLLTVDMLETIERIGRKQLHPQLLISPAMPVRRLMGYPYDEQARLCSQPIDVVVRVANGKPVVSKKTVREMSRLELKRALGERSVRSVEEQARLWIPKHGEGNAEWQALGQKSKTVRTFASSNGEEKMHMPAPPPANVSIIGRWVIRKTIGKNVGFERTNANPPDLIRVILKEGSAVIEVCQRDG